MATFVNTKIIISKPVKQKSFGFYIIIDRKNPDHLTIKAHDYKDRSKGIAGTISRNGDISKASRHAVNLDKVINTKQIQDKIVLALDLTYGLHRLKMATVDSKGLAVFHPTIALIDKPKKKSNLIHRQN